MEDDALYSAALRCIPMRLFVSPSVCLSLRDKWEHGLRNGARWAYGYYGEPMGSQLGDSSPTPIRPLVAPNWGLTTPMQSKLTSQTAAKASVALYMVSLPSYSRVLLSVVQL